MRSAISSSRETRFVADLDSLRAGSTAVCDVVDSTVVAARSVHDAALEEAARHKWIESQKHGRDLGGLALDEWFRRHWLPYCRFCRLEHLRGRNPWREFGHHDFGRLSELLKQGDLLLDRIFDRLECGQENLDVINWAMDWGLDIDRVIELLELVDINRARLEPSYIVGQG